MNNKEIIEARIATLKELEKEYDSTWDRTKEAYEIFLDRMKLIRDQIEAIRRDGGGPLVGMPCTYNIGSDRHAGKVTEVRKNGREVHVELLREDGVAWDNLWFTVRKTGVYRTKGLDSGSLTFLIADNHCDPDF